MKTKITLFLATVLLLTGCDWFKDLDDVKISTNLYLDIPVTAVSVKSVNLTEEISIGSFSATQDLELADNSDIEPYLEKIKEIDLNSMLVTVTGLGVNQTINSISLAVTGVGTLCTQTNITSENNTFTPVIDESLLNQAAAKLKNDKKITVTVSGSTTGAMSFTVSLDIDADITANALD